MKHTIFIALTLAASIALAPVAFAAEPQLENYTERAVTLKSGKAITILVGKMDGETMAIIRANDLNELLSRAEGHTITVK